MSKVVGYCVLYLSALISNVYLAANAVLYGYFAWFAVPAQRCYALNDKAFNYPFYEDGAERHDVTTDF